MTCRHYRFQVPREDADELRAADPEPCPVCDTLPRRNFQTVIWSPKLIRPGNASPLGTIRGWLLNLFQDYPAPAEADHNAPGSAVSSC